MLLAPLVFSDGGGGGRGCGKMEAINGGLINAATSATAETSRAREKRKKQARRKKETKK